MKGDFSRIRFNPAQQYTAVLKQQGRVDLDSDANEQCLIDGYQSQAINTDVIGPYGGPEDDAGFAITVNIDGIQIGPGRYYVNGLLVENPQQISYDDQTYLINSTPAAELISQLSSAGSGASLQFVLEVWQRLVTGLDDPCLLDPALNQADTTVRLQTVWRVVGSVVSSAEPVEGTNLGADADVIGKLSPCCQSLYDTQFTLMHTGQMSAGLNQAGTDCGCQPIAAAGYQGLENQLYRIEIHQGGNMSSATFKWSRENGSVVTQVTQVGVNSATITVSSLGPDANLGFQAGQWVELTDDSYQFGNNPNQPGMLYQIYSVQQSTLQVTMTTVVSGIDTTKNARMRRWDQSGASATAEGVPVSGSAITLENGINVSFSGGQFVSGDYWTFAARTASGTIDWPPCGGNGSTLQNAYYVSINRAPLACVQVRPLVLENLTNLEIAKQETAAKSAAAVKSRAVLNAGTGVDNNLLPIRDRFVVSDCRLLFPPLSAITIPTPPQAVHVSSTSWTNDDVMTVDALLTDGLSVTMDTVTTNPWGGGNFQVSLEPPMGLGDIVAVYEGQDGIPTPTVSQPPATDSFCRTVIAMDPPWGVVVNGAQINWITPTTAAVINNTVDVAANSTGNRAAILLWAALNNLLTWLTPIGYARVRVRLIGGAIYANGVSGNIYLDGQSFGSTGQRAIGGSESVSYALPSGNSLNVSDYEGWFYLAPTVLISAMTIQLLNGSAVVGTNGVTVIADRFSSVASLEVTGSSPAVTVTAIQAVLTFSYATVAPVTLSLQLSGTGVSTVVTMQGTATVAAGQSSVNIPINIVGNPGVTTVPGAASTPNVDTVTLSASITNSFIPLPFSGTLPTLVITGSTSTLITIGINNPVQDLGGLKL